MAPRGRGGEQVVVVILDAHRPLVFLDDVENKDLLQGLFSFFFLRRLSDWLKLVAFVGEGGDRDSEGPSTFTLSLYCSVLTAPHQTYKLNPCLDQVICTW
jgi:hypothetical protein